MRVEHLDKANMDKSLYRDYRKEAMSRTIYFNIGKLVQTVRRDFLSTFQNLEVLVFMHVYCVLLVSLIISFFVCIIFFVVDSWN